MKRIICILLCIAAVCGAAGCAETEKSVDDDSLEIVATIFPEYDWMRILTDGRDGGTELTLLLDKGVDLHSYQPTVADIGRISTCDVFVYAGGESDGWVDEVMTNRINSDMVIINLMELLGDAVKEEETVEGMQPEEDEHGDGEPEYDEHVWLSLKNAVQLCNGIAEKLSQADAANADIYTANARKYTGELSALDAEYAAAVESAVHKTLLFCDRFPFYYLVQDYGISYYAAFPGCSAETEASFETVSFLAAKADELNLPCVLTLDGSDKKIAETVISNTKNSSMKILSMNSLQTTSYADAQGGVTYLSVMQRNLDTLKAALN